MRYQLTGYYFTPSKQTGRIFGEIDVNQESAFKNEVTDFGTMLSKVKIEGRFIKERGLIKFLFTTTEIAHDTTIETEYSLKKRGVKELRGAYKGYLNMDGERKRIEILIS